MIYTRVLGKSTGAVLSPARSTVDVWSPARLSRMIPDNAQNPNPIIRAKSSRGKGLLGTPGKLECG